MTPATFKNRYMTRVKFFAKYKKEPFESFETLEDTYKMPEVSSSEIKFALSNALSTLMPREERVIRERFLNNKTLKEVSSSLSITSERLRQIEIRALLKLKHPSRSRILWEMIKTLDT